MRLSQDVGAVHVSGTDVGQVPQASPFAQAVRKVTTGIAEGLRTSGKAIAHAADDLRATEAVHSGFDRARLD